MSILGLFDIGKSALIASQTALNTTSNNIANVNTPGYSKEDVVLNISSPLQTSAGSVGTGVTAASIERSYNRFLQAQLLGQQQSQSQSAAMDQTWGQIESLLNEQQGAGLSSAMNDFFNAWNDVATAPDSLTARTVLLQKANVLTQQAATIERGITNTVDGANASITDSAAQVNTLASNIADLNRQIIQQEVSGGPGSAIGLRDQRDSQLSNLAKLVDFTTHEDANGSVTVVVGMRNLVSGTTTNAMSTATGTDGNQSVYLDGMNINNNIGGGQMGGLIAARNSIQSTVLTSVRQLAASITQQVNSLHTQGFALDGTNGNNFFNPLQLTTTANSGTGTISATITSQAALTLDEYAITVDSTNNYHVIDRQTGTQVSTGTYNPAGTTIALSGMNVTLNGAIGAADSFTVSPLVTAVSNFQVAQTNPGKVAASATLAGVPGDNGIASQIAQLTDNTGVNLGGTTFSDYYNGVVSAVGAAKRSTADSLTFDNNVLAGLQAQRDSVSGVSLDEEATNLLKFQRSYEAAARVINVADQLLQTLMNM